MKLITISGPHGAGKGTIQDRLLAEYPDWLHRVVPVTTRKPRDGEVHGREYYFITEDDFAGLRASDQLVYQVTIRTHHSGTTRSELMRADKTAFIDITPEGARHLRQLVLKESGEVFSIFVSATEQERFERIKARQPQLSEEAVQRMLTGDPVPCDVALYSDFELVLSNPDGQLGRVMKQVTNAIQRFIGLVAQS